MQIQSSGDSDLAETHSKVEGGTVEKSFGTLEMGGSRVNSTYMSIDTLCQLTYDIAAPTTPSQQGPISVQSGPRDEIGLSTASAASISLGLYAKLDYLFRLTHINDAYQDVYQDQHHQLQPKSRPETQQSNFRLRSRCSLTWRQ